MTPDDSSTTTAAPADATAPVREVAPVADRQHRRALAAERQRERNAALAPIIPDRVPWPAVITFLAIALGAAWAIQSPLWISGDGLAHPLFFPLTLGMMFTPALAAIVVVLVVHRPRSIPRLLGLAPLRPMTRTLGLVALAAVAFPVLAIASMLLGHAMGLVRLDLVGLSGLAEFLAAQGQVDVSREMLVGIAVAQLLIIPLNIVGSSIAAFGEELGWRGWLLPNLLPLGTWPALIVTGLAWGVWHAPIILLGYNYGRTDLLGVLLMTGWCVMLGILIGWLRLRSASVWPAVIAHGAVNGSTGALFVFVAAGADGSVVFGTLLGWPGWILMAALIVVLVVTGQSTKRAVPGLTLSEAASPTSAGRGSEGATT
ncbi:MAG: hypothetical protein RI885_483 [Actinomycetota bacterium]